MPKLWGAPVAAAAHIEVPLVVRQEGWGNSGKDEQIEISALVRGVELTRFIVYVLETNDLVFLR
jgi:hypothetical protein